MKFNLYDISYKFTRRLTSQVLLTRQMITGIEYFTNDLLTRDAKAPFARK